MFKTNRKKNISKYFLLSILVFCLIITSLGYNIDNSYAMEFNQTSDIDEVELNVENKVVNSQLNVNENNGEILSSVSSNFDRDSISLSGSLENTDYLKSDNTSQNSIVGVNLEDEYLLGTTYTVKSGTFADIQNAITKAKAGDTIKLSGTFKATSSISVIKVTKKLTITADSVATLNGLNKYRIIKIYAGGEGTVIRNLKFINSEGGRGSALRISTHSVTVENCIFQNNHCTKGGALGTDYDLETPRNLIVRKCTFIGNVASVYGDNSAAGGAGIYGKNSQVIDCLFDSNHVLSDVDCYGGALQIGMDKVNSSCKVTNCIFKNNYAVLIGGTSHGGAGCVRDGVDYVKCTFINNTADQGGALTMHASGNIIDCTFTDNHANKLYGGAISSGYLFDTMVLKISNCNFNGNTAPEGGAIQAIGLNVAISNSVFTNNKVTGKGGAIAVQAVNVSIDNSNFISNIAEVNGGAIYLTGDKTTVSNSLFEKNMAIPDANKLNDGLGGAIYINSPKATIADNEFNLNTARNGSAIYYEVNGKNLYLSNNTLYQNQAWVYNLPIYADDIFYEDMEEIKVVIYGGNNIADYDNLAISNAIYNAANYNEIMIDGENPIYGASSGGELYQDGREYNIAILLTVNHEDGTVVYNNYLNSSYLGEISVDLDNLKPGKYYVSAKHFEDTYYKEITNITSFTVYPKIDNQITITTPSTTYNYEDVVVWTINITNNGPNNATEVIVNNILPDGMIFLMDTSGGKYNSTTGVLNVSKLNVGEKISFNIITTVNKTGELTAEVNITAHEFDTDLSNNYDSQTIMVNPSADLAVLKTVNETNPNYQDLINWTIVIHNRGPDIAHNITVHDIIPSTLILINYTGNYNVRNGVWKIESLDVGESAIINVITRVDATGIIENNVDAYAVEFDYDLSNNRDSEIILVDPSSDLEIIKTVNASEVNYLDTVKWTLTIKNNGPDNATGVKIVDVLPDGFTYINSTFNYENDEIFIGDLEVSKTMVIDIICLVENTGNFTNYANITGREYDYNLENNQDNESIIVHPACDLEIEKTVDEMEPNYGDIVEWTIVVRNNGPDDAHEVVVYDLFTNDLIYIEDDSDGEYDPQTGKWDVGFLEAYDEVSLTIYSKVNKTGVLTNVANVTGREYDYDLTNNHDNESIEVEPSADVSIIKSVNNTNPNYYELIKWTVIVSNNGPDNATDVEIMEKIPDGLILLDSSVTKGIYDGESWVMDCLEKDETQTLELICKVNKTGNITNIVNVTAEEYDPNETNNEANSSIDVPPAVDIEVIQNVNNSYPRFGEEIIWMISVKNNGPDNATKVELTDVLSASLIFVNYNSTRGNYSDGIWNIGLLNVGDIEYINITCITNKTGITINDAQATALEYDWNMSNNYDSALIDVLPVSDLVVEKYVNSPTPNYLDIITWTLKVINNGPNDDFNVKVTDSIPAGLSFIKSSDDANYRDGIWYVGKLQTGEARQLNIICKVISTGIIKNIATVEGENYDPDLNNNYDEESISVKPASDLSVTKVTSKTKYVVGDKVRYKITVVNNGPDAAYNVRVSDILDKSLILKSFKTAKGSFDKSTKVWQIDCLENGESAILLIDVVATASGVVENTVIVTSDSYDYNMSNNNASCFINVSVKPKEVIPHKSAKNLLHKTGNPLLFLSINLIVLSALVYRKFYFK